MELYGMELYGNGALWDGALWGQSSMGTELNGTELYGDRALWDGAQWDAALWERVWGLGLGVRRAVQKRFALRPLGFRWKEESTPEKGPGTASVGCHALSSSAAPPAPTPGHPVGFWGCPAPPKPCPTPGLGLRLPPGLPMEGGREAVLSGVGLQLDSLESSSSSPEQRCSGFLGFGGAAVPPPALALAARSCLRNLARRFWNHTWGGTTAACGVAAGWDWDRGGDGVGRGGI